jgi:ABC-type dipeptide/oligopeptide/nickel transport system permease component
MKKAYILKRTFVIIPTFIVATAIMFSLLHLAPGDPVKIMVRSSGKPMSPEIIETLRTRYGLDKPLYIQYINWLTNFLRGNLGYSYVTNQKIGNILPRKIILTLELVLSANIISMAFAILFGVIAAVKKNSVLDNLLSVFAIFAYSMPYFWFCLMAIYLFSLKLGLTPVAGSFTAGAHLKGVQYLIDNLRHLILPVSVLSLSYLAYYFRLVRSCMLDVLNESYIVAARAKGVTEGIVVYKHAFRNALLPIVTFFAISLGFVLAGSIVTETIFGWPGLGKLLVTAAFQRDYMVILSINAVIIMMVLFANLVADVACSYADPRIRY